MIGSRTSGDARLPALLVLSFHTPPFFSKFVKTNFFSTMAKPNTEPITQSIDALRTESSPDAVNPARVANLLQAIVDLINALTMVPDSEVTNIIQQINNAVSTANAASSAASAAQTNANNKKITQFKADAAADAVTLTVKQAGHTAMTFSFPIADASHAGIVLPAVLQQISNAATAAANNAVAQLLLSTYANKVTFGTKTANDTVLQKDIPAATQSKAGVMSSADKTKLDALPASGIAALDAAARVPAANAPQVMIRNVADQSGYFDEHPLQNGDFWFEGGHIFFHESATSDIDMGVPSKNVVYCHTDTDILYRWTGSVFTPTKTNPNEGLEMRRINVYSASTKRYDIPSGIFARIHPTTNVLNINLLAPTSGVPFYRIFLDSGAFFDDSDALIVDQINWPINTHWQNEPPTIDDVIENYGVIVTIIDDFARFDKY